MEKQIVSSGIGLLTTALIRELVDAKLIERGLEQARRLHARLGFPLYDVRQLIFHQNKENANVPHAPEGTNLVLVEGIKREYALHDVFSREVGDAHVSGDLHLHGLGYIDRPYSACQSLEYLKRFGLKLPHSVTVAGPARHAEVLLAHMVRFGASLQGHFAGVIGWDAVNLSFAPYLTGMGEREIEQFAQMLVYEFSQLTSARGGQAIFTDIHLYWEVPRFFRRSARHRSRRKAHRPDLSGVREEAQTVRPGAHDASIGRETPRASRSSSPGRSSISRMNSSGPPAMRSFWRRPAASPPRRGIPASSSTGSEARPLAPCGCHRFSRERMPRDSPGEPWRRRCASIQNVTLNLPRLGYRAGEDDGKLFSLLDELMALAAKAHVQKRDFIEKLLALGDAGPSGHAGHAERRRPLSPDGRCRPISSG